MAQRIDEIVQQARQGSMAALIQLMNERLAEAGIRTRAMFAEGILQILCEAATVERLEQQPVVQNIRGILEDLAPPNFRRIRINARIAREQQLLWLEEISRDPENQLLWSEEILLTPPNLFQQFKKHLQDRQSQDNNKRKPDKSLTGGRSRSRPYWQGMAGGAALSLLILGGAWGIYRWYSSQGDAVQLVRTENTAQVPASQTAISTGPPSSSDSFAQAIRLAEDSAIKGKTANTAAQWLDLAAKWQQASDLMGAVPQDDPRYGTARERVIQYRQNSEMAQKQAQAQRQTP